MFHGLIGLPTELCVQAGLLGRLPDWAGLLAVLHGLVVPLTGFWNHLWPDEVQTVFPRRMVPLFGLHSWAGPGTKPHRFCLGEASGCALQQVDATI